MAFALEVNTGVTHILTNSFINGDRLTACNHLTDGSWDFYMRSFKYCQNCLNAKPVRLANGAILAA